MGNYIGKKRQKPANKPRLTTGTLYIKAHVQKKDLQPQIPNIDINCDDKPTRFATPARFKTGHSPFAAAPKPYFVRWAAHFATRP